MIDRINEQKAELNNHSVVDEMKVKALAELDNWKANKIEAIIAIYNAKRLHIENVCEQSIIEKSKVQNAIFEDLNTTSNTIEKKKNVHPHDIVQLEQKLNELNTLIKKIQDDADAQLTNTVTNIRLPELIELEQRLQEAQERIKNMTQEHQQKIDAENIKIRGKDSDLLNLQRMIKAKDQEINNLKQNGTKICYKKLNS